MADDPFRSLAGALRVKGGYAKDTTPFSEFLWADFLRRRIDEKVVEKDYPAALEAAIGLAKKKKLTISPAGAALWKRTVSPTDRDRGHSRFCRAVMRRAAKPGVACAQSKPVATPSTAPECIEASRATITVTTTFA